MVRLENETGAAGYGEVAPVPGFGGETVDHDEAALRVLGDRCDEAQFADLPAKFAGLKNALRAAVVGPYDRLAAVSAQRSTSMERAAYLPVAALLPAGRAVLMKIPPLLEAGFRVFKWKVGVADAADELAWLDELCAVLPEGARLRLDANGAWDRRRAERWLERCAERPVEFVEQPIAATARGADDLLLGLAADHPTPLALDESLVGDGDIERWLGAGWPDIFVIKPSLLADVDGALSRLAAARAAVVFSSALETAIGAQAALRVAFGWRGQPRALGFGVWPLFMDSRFDGPALAPFIRWEDVERINPEAVWNALS